MKKQLEPIKDHFGRPLKDLSISVIDQCNLSCTYCIPKELLREDYGYHPESELLSCEEITRMADNFASLCVNKIQIPGREPLMRKNLEQLIDKLTKRDGIDDIALTTNGFFLP